MPDLDEFIRGFGEWRSAKDESGGGESELVLGFGKWREANKSPSLPAKLAKLGFEGPAALFLDPDIKAGVLESLAGQTAAVGHRSAGIQETAKAIADRIPPEAETALRVASHVPLLGSVIPTSLLNARGMTEGPGKAYSDVVKESALSASEDYQRLAEKQPEGLGGIPGEVLRAGARAPVDFVATAPLMAAGPAAPAVFGLDAALQTAGASGKASLDDLTTDEWKAVIKSGGLNALIGGLLHKTAPLPLAAGVPVSGLGMGLAAGADENATLETVISQGIVGGGMGALGKGKRPPTKEPPRRIPPNHPLLKEWLAKIDSATEAPAPHPAETPPFNLLEKAIPEPPKAFPPEDREAWKQAFIKAWGGDSGQKGQPSPPTSPPDLPPPPLTSGPQSPGPAKAAEGSLFGETSPRPAEPPTPPSPPPSDNPYMKIPLDRVRRDAEMGVRAAQEALRARSGEGKGNTPPPSLPPPPAPPGKAPPPKVASQGQPQAAGGVSPSAFDTLLSTVKGIWDSAKKAGERAKGKPPNSPLGKLAADKAKELQSEYETTLAEIEAEHGADVADALRKRTEGGFFRPGAVFPVETTLKLANAIMDVKLPKMNAIGNGEIADQAHRHASAYIQAPTLVRALIGRMTPEPGDLELLPKLKATLDKDNILGLYDQRMAEAKAASQRGDLEASRKATKQASDIFHEHNLKQYEQDVKAALQDIRIAHMVDLYKDEVMPILDALYQETRGIDPSEPAFHRGRYTETHSNLLSEDKLAEWKSWNTDPSKAAMPDFSGGAKGHMNPKIRADAFARRAKGTGSYAADMEATLSSVIAPRLNNASKLQLYETIVKHGGGYWKDAPPQAPVEGSFSAFPVPQRNGTTRTLMVRSEIVPELRGVLNTDLRQPSNPVLNLLNTAQISINPVDAISHVHNLMAELMYAQGYGKSTVADLARKVVPLATTTTTIYRLADAMVRVHQGGQPILEQIARMSGEGSWRPEHKPQGIQKLAMGHKIITVMDQASRIVMDDLFSELVRRGTVEDTPGNRRDFVNRLGAYNRRIAGPVERWLKEKGISPFVTAGRRMAANAIEQGMASPQVRASSNANAAKLRAINIAGHLSTLMLPAIINALTTGNPLGRPGTPFGAIDLGMKRDEKDKFPVIDPLQWLGARRAMRVTGLNSLYEGLRSGKTANQISGAMGEEIGQQFMHPWFGPGIGFLYKVLTGQSLDLRGKMEASVSPEHQKLENTRAALESQNPPMYALVKPALEQVYSRLGMTMPDRGATRPDLATKAGEKIAGKPGAYVGSVLESPVKSMKSAFGVGQSKETHSAAEDLIQTYLRADRPKGMTPEESASAELRGGLLTGLRNRDPGANDRLVAAIREGKITSDQAKRLIERSKQDPLVYSLGSSNLQFPQALRVMEVATPEERAKLKNALVMKWLRLYKSNPQEALKYREAVLAIRDEKAPGAP